MPLMRLSLIHIYPEKLAWASEYTQLKELLTPEEYAAARSSTLNAHYTSPTVIQAIYEAVDRMGFETGNILEPSMGVGNFFGMLPEEMRNSRLYGVELDPVSGRIAKQLYPKGDSVIIRDSLLFVNCNKARRKVIVCGGPC